MLKCDLFAVANLIIYQCQIRNTAAAILRRVCHDGVRAYMYVGKWVGVCLGPGR